MSALAGRLGQEPADLVLQIEFSLLLEGLQNVCPAGLLFLFV